MNRLNIQGHMGNDRSERAFFFIVNEGHRRDIQMMWMLLSIWTPSEHSKLNWLHQLFSCIPANKELPKGKKKLHLNVNTTTSTKIKLNSCAIPNKCQSHFHKSICFDFWHQPRIDKSDEHILPFPQGGLGSTNLMSQCYITMSCIHSNHRIKKSWHLYSFIHLCILSYILTCTM